MHCSPCGFAVMCLYYNKHSSDFTHDSALMGIACYGEIASGMFVLFLPVVPRFFTHVREHTFFSSSANLRAPSALEFSDIGVTSKQGAANGDARQRERKQSQWHISYTHRNSEDTRPIIPSLRREDFGPKSLAFEPVSPSMSSESP